MGLAVLLGDRITLRWKNLHDTSTFPTLAQPDPQATGTAYLTERTIDGTFNDLRDPRMGATGTRFGRNVPNEYTWPDPETRIMSPNPRVVSRELLTRDSFAPATSLNLLAAAWIQFMTRDWLSHGTGDITQAFQVPLPPGDDFPQNPILIPRTIADPTRPPATPPRRRPTSTWRHRGGTRRRSIRPIQRCSPACGPGPAASSPRHGLAAARSCRRRCSISSVRCLAGGLDWAC